MVGRAVLLGLLAAVFATTVGAAPQPGRNGLIALVREQGDNTTVLGLYTISARGSRRARVTTLQAWGPPSWAPNGHAIAFPGIDDVVVASVDGRSYRKLGVELPFASGGVEVAWSPDGRRIAIAAEADPLYVKTLGGPLRRITRGEATTPVWSPDGRHIAYVLAREFDGDVLMVARSDGSRRRRLSNSWGSRPSWSPDGKMLVVADPAITLIDVRSGRRRRLTRRPGDANPVWSPDGGRIAFQRRRSRTDTEIFTIRPDGSGVTRLTHNRESEASLTWSPGGRSLAYTSRGDVFVVGRAVRKTRKLSRERCGAGAHWLTWSPRGGRLAFGALPYGTDAEIFTVGADGSGLRELTHNCRAADHNPAWSPGGDRLAFDRATGSGQSRIFVMRSDGTRVRRVTSGPSRDTSPSWSPGGAELLFSRNGELFVTDADGRGERQLTDTPGANYEGDWSPQSRIAFTSTRDGIPQVYVMNADGSGATRLTDARGYLGASQPAWSPDTSRIAFVRDYNVWTMNADGTGATALTRRDGYTRAQHPSWSPDGTKIVFSADVDAGRGSQYALVAADVATGTERYIVFEQQNNLEPDWQALR